MKAAVRDPPKHQATLYVRWALTHALDELGSPPE
jgi:hypothetical protein